MDNKKDEWEKEGDKEIMDDTLEKRQFLFGYCQTLLNTIESFTCKC